MGQFTEDRYVMQSRLDRIAEARRWATQQARAAGFDEDGVSAIELALAEALANVIEHGYQGDENQEIRLTLRIDDEKLTLTIRDFGQKFDPQSYSPPDLSNPSEGGYGVFLIHQLMDEVIYDTSLPQGMKLTLVRYRTPRGD
ncbi:MAG: ATP-binding protein [Caldilineae bacterium]|nr:MAG: ATP-binding protein [Caldilineae bacterium]